MKSSYKQLNFKRMTNLKSNLRKVATIIACLAVTTMFVACDGNNDDDNGNENGSGKIDQKLVGEWEVRAIPVIHYCSFRSNGTFISSETGGGSTYNLSGNYTTSNGWITLSNVVARVGDGVLVEKWLKTYRVEYRFEKNPDGKNDYLNMGSLMYSELPEIPLDGFWARWTKK